MVGNVSLAVLPAQNSFSVMVLNLGFGIWGINSNHFIIIVPKRYGAQSNFHDVFTGSFASLLGTNVRMCTSLFLVCYHRFKIPIVRSFILHFTDTYLRLGNLGGKPTAGVNLHFAIDFQWF